MQGTLTFGQMLQRARFAKGLSLRQLSEATGVSVGAIKRAEADQSKPYGQTIFRLAEGLDLNPDNLLDALEAAV
jgi:transcriptional regulator with XRE-family HTH domain